MKIETIHAFYNFKSLCICDVNSGHLYSKQTEISQKQTEQRKIFKISYYIISKVLKNEMIKIIEVLSFALYVKRQTPGKEKFLLRYQAKKSK
jgi:hypothetical protein